MSETLSKSQHCHKVLDKVSDEVSDKGRNRPFRDKLYLPTPINPKTQNPEPKPRTVNPEP